MLTRIYVWLATALGLGLVMPAPGTWGAACGLGVAYGLTHLPPPAAWTVVAVFLVVGGPMCTVAARSLGGKDPSAVVWDELATVPLVFGIVPLDGWPAALWGFALHRLFDITKPWPCRLLEKWPEGWGIMADDVMAAVYAAVGLASLAWLGVV